MTRKHILIMLACCMIPIVILAAIYLFNIPLSTILLATLVIVCPLTHLLMMKFMVNDHQEIHNPVSKDHMLGN